MDIHRRQLHCQEGSASVVMKVTADVMRMILHAPGEVDDGQPELSPKNAHIQPMEYGFAPVEWGQAVSFVVDQQHWIAGFNTVALEVWHHSSLESLLTMALARDDVSLLPRAVPGGDKHYGPVANWPMISPPEASPEEKLGAYVQAYRAFYVGNGKRFNSDSMMDDHLGKFGVVMVVFARAPRCHALPPPPPPPIPDGWGRDSAGNWLTLDGQGRVVRQENGPCDAACGAAAVGTADSRVAWMPARRSQHYGQGAAQAGARNKDMGLTAGGVPVTGPDAPTLGGSCYSFRPDVSAASAVAASAADDAVGDTVASAAVGGGCAVAEALISELWPQLGKSCRKKHGALKLDQLERLIVACGGGAGAGARDRAASCDGLAGGAAPGATFVNLETNEGKSRVGTKLAVYKMTDWDPAAGTSVGTKTSRGGLAPHVTGGDIVKSGNAAGRVGGYVTFALCGRTVRAAHDVAAIAFICGVKSLYGYKANDVLGVFVPSVRWESADFQLAQRQAFLVKRARCRIPVSQMRLDYMYETMRLPKKARKHCKGGEDAPTNAAQATEARSALEAHRWAEYTWMLRQQ